jgi:hypothetical protein
VDTTVDDLEAEGFVGLLGDEVVDEGVGGYFAAAVGAGPVFGGGEEGAADALASKGGLDVPAFEIADRVGDVAAIGMRAEADLDKGYELFVGGVGDQECERLGGRVLTGELGGEFVGVLGDGAFRPESVAKLGEAVEVRGSGEADHRSRVQGARGRVQVAGYGSLGVRRRREVRGEGWWRPGRTPSLGKDAL